MTILDLAGSMVGQRCWHVSAGGVTAPSFLLVMGRKLVRDRPLNNPAQPEAFRKYRGSVELLIWSSWRLQTDSRILASSDQGSAGLGALDVIKDEEVVAFACTPPGWDLRVEFSNGITIVTFSDHVDDESSVPENWELWTPGRCVRAGPGSNLEDVEE